MPQMTPEDLKAAVTKELQASKPSAELVRSRKQGLEIYRGDTSVPGYEVRQGHSSVVSRNAMDTVEWLLPGLIKMFHGSKKISEYEATSMQEIPGAEQATDYANYVYNRQNPGRLITYQWFKDALIQKNGFIKHWWATEKKTQTSTHDGLTVDELIELVEPDDVTVLEQREDDGLWSAKIRRVFVEKRIRIENVPPEEVRVSKKAKLTDFDFLAHVTRKSPEEMIAQGFDEKTIRAASSEGANPGGMEASSRYKSESTSRDEEDDEDITVSECYHKIDFDGDGIAEWRKITVLGEEGNGAVLDNEEIVDVWDHWSTLSPIINPHSFWGESSVDSIADIQLVETTLLRQMLDNLYRTNNPQKKVRLDGLSKGCEGDVLVSRPDGLIRVDDMDAVEAFEVPFTAAASLPMLQVLREKQEGRTGVGSQNASSNPDILKSHQTTGAVERVMSNSQERKELIGFLFAHTGFKNLMRAILQLSVRYQDKEKIVRLRNKYVPIDPRHWNAEMETIIHVGLGTGNKDGLKNSVVQMIEFQKEARTAPELGLMDPTNGKKIYNALDEFAKASEFESAERFFVDPDSDEGQALREQAREQAEGRKSEAELFLEAEQAKVQADMQKHQSDQQLKVVELQMEDDRERDKFEAELILKAADLEQKGTKVDLDLIKITMERERNLLSTLNQGPVQ